MFNMLKDAYKLKREMGRMKDGLASVEAEGISSDGGVRVVMDGQMRFKGVSIAQELIARGDALLLGDLIVQAANQAREKAQMLAAGELKKLTGADIPLPF